MVQIKNQVLRKFTGSLVKFSAIQVVDKVITHNHTHNNHHIHGYSQSQAVLEENLQLYAYLLLIEKNIKYHDFVG